MHDVTRRLGLLAGTILVPTWTSASVDNESADGNDTAAERGSLRLVNLSGSSELALLMGDFATAATSPTMADVLAAAKPADWREADLNNTLYLELSTGRVVIELAPAFAPQHVENIRKLVKQGYFDGLAILRVQENYVVQWGDPDGNRSLGHAAKTLAPEFQRASKGVSFTRLPDGDVYAPEVGFAGGFPVARDANKSQSWLTHCYAMVGVGRDETIGSGNGAELYVVIGHAPRHLDKNITLVGRVLLGMDFLSVLPRGSGPLGFYERPEERVPIRSVRLAADVPENNRTAIELLRTDTATFAALIESRRNRRESWFHVPAGRIDVCNVPLPVRKRTR